MKRNAKAVVTRIKAVRIGFICNHIAQTKSKEGVLTLLNCGRGDDNFFKATDALAASIAEISM